MMIDVPSLPNTQGHQGLPVRVVSLALRPRRTWEDEAHFQEMRQYQLERLERQKRRRQDRLAAAAAAPAAEGGEEEITAYEQQRRDNIRRNIMLATMQCW